MPSTQIKFVIEGGYKLNDLAILETQLPANVDELAKFVLIGTEKLKSLKAEIRAIDKLHLAQEVYDQKLNEQRLLSGLILDAYAKLGEFTTAMPKSVGGRPSENSSFRSEEFIPPKTKKQAIAELGFSKDQVHQFETLAKNKNLIEQEKIQAAEEGRPASRAKVLELAKQRQKHDEKQATKDTESMTTEEFNAYLDHCHKLANFYNKTLFNASMLESGDEHLNAWMELVPEQNRIKEYIALISESIPKLLKIKKYLEGRLKQ
jgi:hypothetical protein